MGNSVISHIFYIVIVRILVTRESLVTLYKVCHDITIHLRRCLKNSCWLGAVQSLEQAVTSG